MMTPAATVRSRPAVRAPFRFLAAVVGLAFVVAVLGTVYMAWHGDRALQVKDVVMLPGGLWLGRLMFLAALGKAALTEGYVSQHDHWPFATGRVAGCYWLLVILFF